MPQPLPRRVGPWARVAAAFIAAGLLTVLLIAAWLRPAAEGHATHTQLGLPACGWATAMGRPCPTCGMTTSFAWAAHGGYVESVRAQPFAALLVVGAAAGFWAALHVALTGSRIGATIGGLVRPRVLWGLAGLALAAWAYKFVTWN